MCIGAIAWITGLAVVNPLIKRNASPMSKVLVLLGMLIVYRETSASLYGYDPLFVPMPFGFGRVEVGPFAGSSQSFFIISVVAVVFLLAWYFFERTIWGKAFEGVAINRQAAMLMGINLKIVGMSSFISAGMIAGLAGVLQAPLTSAHFLMGLPLAIKGFTALVIGGVGRVEGALLGGFLLALLEKLTIRYIDIPSGYALGVPLLLMIVFLLFRPNGIFQNKEAK
jgi:branched-chain amino acid transport system permease protein